MGLQFSRLHEFASQVKFWFECTAPQYSFLQGGHSPPPPPFPAAPNPRVITPTPRAAPPPARAPLTPHRPSLHREGSPTPPLPRNAHTHLFKKKHLHFEQFSPHIGIFLLSLFLGSYFLIALYLGLFSPVITQPFRPQDWVR